MKKEKKKKGTVHLNCIKRNSVFVFIRRNILMFIRFNLFDIFNTTVKIHMYGQIGYYSEYIIKWYANTFILTFNAQLFDTSFDCKSSIYFSITSKVPGREFIFN